MDQQIAVFSADSMNGSADSGVFSRYIGTDEIFVMPDSIDVVAEGAFANCRTLRHIDLRNVRRIECRAFQDCTNLETVVMRNVETVGAMAFAFCRSLRSIDMGDVTEAGERAFFCCSSLDVPEIPCSLAAVGSGAFSHTAIRMADLHWLEEIPPYLLSACTNLVHADISGARRIGAEAFAGCLSLSDVRLDVTEVIESRAFARCDALAASGLPAGLREIHEDAFANVQNGLIVPENVRVIGKNCFGPVGRRKNIRIFRPSLYAMRNYFADDRRDQEFEDEHFYMWESAIDITVLDDRTGGVTGFLPLYSDLGPDLRKTLTGAFRPDNTFDYSVLDNEIFSGLRWNQRCMDRQAIMRIQYPFGLAGDARCRYTEYLTRHLERIARRAIRDRDVDILALLCDNELINEENFIGLTDYSIAAAATECTGLLLERQSASMWRRASVLEEL